MVARMVKAIALGARVRELREQSELTQADLAHRAGIDVSTLSRIETGKAVPGADTVEHLAQALGVRPGDLLGLGDWEVDYSPKEHPEIRGPLAEYLSSPRGRTTPAAVAHRMSDPSLYSALGISKPAWEDFEDVRRLLERHIS